MSTDLQHYFTTRIFLSFFFMYLSSPNLGLTPPGTYNQMPVGINSLWTRTLDLCTRAGLPECSQHNVRASAGDNTGQNTGKGHTSNPRTEIKIPDPSGNRTWATGLEGRDSNDHNTATDIMKSINF